MKEYFISERITRWLLDFKKGTDFVALFFKEAFSGNINWQEVINQCFRIGLNTLPLISLTGFVTGIVFTKQSRPSLLEFGAESWLPSLVTIAVVRALAPLVTSLIAAGKVGSQIGAELGSMRVTEQIDAMEVSSVNPMNYLVVSRVIATTICIPILSFYTGAFALFGSFIDVYMNEFTSFPAFILSAFESVTFLDLFSAIFKAVCFGFTIGIVSCFKGYFASNGTQGVGVAANKSVVRSMFLIFMIEIFVVQITNWLR